VDTLDFPHRADGAGRYRNLRLHRVGGLGRVWLVRDTAVGRDVALKELRPDRTGGTRRLRFLREARVAGQLEHPNIVPLYDLVEDAGGDGGLEGPFYTMRFVAGRTLAEATDDYHRRRREGAATRLDLAGLLEAFVAVCRAVAFAHARGVLHRDLKGQNVALGDFGEVMLLDWGLARKLGDPGAGDEPDGVQPDPEEAPDATPSGGMAGTPPYMGPELVAGEPPSRASDVYALGAILYVILTGQLPYSGNPLEVLAKVRAGGPARPRALNPAVPPALEAVCLRAMARRPEGRYATAEQLADDVRRWMADEPVSAFRDPWTVRAARWARRHRTPVVAAAVFLVSAVVALSVSTGLVWSEQRRTAEEKRQAEGNLLLAREQTRNLLNFSEQWLGSMQQTESIRKAILDQGLQALRQSLEKRPDDPELRELVARLYRYLANVHRLLNEADAASQAYREAVHGYEELAGQFPDRREYRNRLSETLRDASQLLQQTGKLAEAEGVLRRSLAVAEQLRAEVPGQPDYARTLATALLDLADVEADRGRFAESEGPARRGCDLMRGLVGNLAGQGHPLDRLLLTAALTQLGVAQRELGRADEARVTLAEAVKRGRGLVERGGDNNARHFLGRALVEQGRALARLPDRPAEAEASFGEAVQVWQGVRAQAPQLAVYRDWLAVAHQERGRLLTARKALGPAADDLDQSRRLLESLVEEFPGYPAYRGDLGRTYQALSRLAAARGEANQAADWLRRSAEALRAARAASPENAADRLSLAEVEAELGRPPGGNGG
jgi:serine/threonine protein kinase